MSGGALAEEKMLTLAPAAATREDETHAALALAPGVYRSPIRYSGRVSTLAQLRTGSPPNAWECAWLVWNYQDAEHFYYLALKPNGWELGKRDPAYRGGQRFLATGQRGFALGSWRKFRIVQKGGEIVIAVDGAPLVTFVDRSQPVYVSGRLGIYTEDARVALEDVSRPFVQTFDGFEVQTVTADGAQLGDWTAPFLGFGAASIEKRP